MSKSARVKSPPDMLADIGRALYGEHWRRPLADALGMDERQIRRYVNGDTLRADHELFGAALKVLHLHERETRHRAQEMRLAAAELARWLKPHLAEVR